MRIGNKLSKILSLITGALLAVVAAGPQALADEAAFSELVVLIEINATDGDVGFHVKHDGDGWYNVSIIGPDGLIFDETALGPLAEQGITENFFESAEPPCWFEEGNPDVDWDEDEVVTLAEFLDRFSDGAYDFSGISIDDELFYGSATLTYDLPAAPVVKDIENAKARKTALKWKPGDDLGNCAFEDTDIPDPASVEVVAWEVVVEPDDDDYDEPVKRIFSAQLPAHQTSIRIPAAYLESFADDVTEFKYEVGALEASGNRTFSEASLELRENGRDEDSDD